MFKPKLPSIQPSFHAVADLSIEPFRFVNPNLALLSTIKFLYKLFKEGVHSLCIFLLSTKLSELNSELLYFSSVIRRWWSRWYHLNIRLFVFLIVNCPSFQLSFYSMITSAWTKGVCGF